jgi:hypothetical protein
MDRTTNECFNQLVSEEVQDLIYHKPSWVVRNANVVFLSILSAFLAFSWFIYYPDVIKGPIKLVAVNPPKLLVAKVESRLEKLLVSNEQDVVKNQPLAFLQSTGKHEQVLCLQKWLVHIDVILEAHILDSLVTISLPSFDQLGELQSDFQSFENAYSETLQILRNGYYEQKRSALLKDMDYLSSIHENTWKQQQLLKRDYELQQQEYEADKQLAKDSVIARVELNQNESKVIAKRSSLEQCQSQLIGNELSKQDKQKELMDLDKFVADQRQKFRSELYTLKSNVESWLQQFVLFAPEDGKLLYASFLQENELLFLGQELFYVQPQQNHYYGQMSVSQVGLGKIRPGQSVILRFQSFPSTEFGVIAGNVEYILPVPNSKDSFFIKVALPNGLRTNYSKTLFFRNNLVADGEIITNQRRLSERFFGQIKEIMKRK